MANHEMTNMGEPKTMGEGSMNMGMNEPSERDQEVRAKEKQLDHLRALQRQLDHASEGEAAAQKKEDARALELMESDPRGHVEMMKTVQQHESALELRRPLLEREAQVFQELQSAQAAAQAKMPETGKLMMEMVAMARWSQIPLLGLGLWLIASPFTLGYSSELLAWSDIVSGILVMALAIIAFRTKRVWAAWVNTFVGLWLTFAPLVFSVPEAAAYANGTLVGILVTVFAMLIPMMLTMPGPEIPLGWSYNPSSWLQRAPVLALALLSFLMARYMAAYQLGHIPWVWDPIFGDGTALVLTSDVSKAFPISDAGLGAFSYLIEFLSGFMGDSRRWRTMPWMVILFGFLVVPLGIVSVGLVIMQPVVVGEWCTLCLITALFMLIMVELSIDEVIATLQFLQQTRRAGKPLWRTFWLGGDAMGDYQTPRPHETTSTRQMVLGATAPWNLVLSAVLGAWLLAAPSVFQTQGPAAISDQIFGALVVTVAIVAFAEVSRAARFINIFLALGIIGLPWLLDGGTTAASLNDLVIGAMLIVLSIPPGKIKNTYDTWNSLIV